MADAPGQDPARRGQTTIADRVVEHIAVISAREVSDVVPTHTTLERVTGRQYPKAEAQVAGDRARLHVQVAVAWPSPLGATTARVRETVGERLRQLTGLNVDRVDVTAARVVSADQAPPPRRVR